MSDPSAAQPEGLPPPSGLLARLLAAPRYLYHAHLGGLLGHRFMLLIHEGRRTHRLHETPLEVVHWDPVKREAIVASGWGRKAQWLHNVEAGMACEVVIGRERFEPEVRELEVPEAMDVLRAYENHNGLPKAVVRRVLSWLLGWTYDGSDDARRRAVQQLPLVGFRPRD
jgi:deazaflavin-dependent oxidoreductase (nitroreductase family)